MHKHEHLVKFSPWISHNLELWISLNLALNNWPQNVLFRCMRHFNYKRISWIVQIGMRTVMPKLVLTKNDCKTQLNHMRSSDV